MTINRCISVKNILGRNAIPFCECEVIYVFIVVVCVVTAVHKFDLKIVINETSKKKEKRRPMVGTSWNDNGLYF